MTYLISTHHSHHPYTWNTRSKRLQCSLPYSRNAALSSVSCHCTNRLKTLGYNQRRGRAIVTNTETETQVYSIYKSVGLLRTLHKYPVTATKTTYLFGRKPKARRGPFSNEELE